MRSRFERLLRIAVTKWKRNRWSFLRAARFVNESAEDSMIDHWIAKRSLQVYAYHKSMAKVNAEIAHIQRRRWIKKKAVNEK